jgi:hypothetical protein
MTHPSQPQPPYPGQSYPGQPSPGQPSPAQGYPAQPSPAQGYPAQPAPAQPYPAQPYPAQPSPQRTYPLQGDPPPYGAGKQWAPHAYGTVQGTPGSAPGHAPPPPHGPPHQAPPPRRPRLGLGMRIAILVGGVLLVGGIANAARGDRSAPEAATPAVVAADGVSPARPATGTAAAFPGAQDGDLATQPDQTLALDDLAVTTTALRDGDATFGRTLCTTVTYLNGGSGSASYGSFDWNLQNPSGAIVALTFFGGPDNQLGSGELAPGGTVSGEVCFPDENASSGQYVVLYDPLTFLSDDRLAWLNPR